MTGENGRYKEIHVSPDGSDTQTGSESLPLRTISAAADLAHPGDTIIVHGGVYREYINPPRGGSSENLRITYRAADGEKVTIKGSEPLGGWKKVGNDTWSVTVSNKLFGDFNPYADLIEGDWFNANGREHHTGAIYLDGHWLTEAITLDHVLMPVGEAALSYLPGGKKRILAVGWIAFGDESAGRTLIQGTDYSDHSGVYTFNRPDSDERFIVARDGDWAKYDVPDQCGFEGEMEFHVSALHSGGRIEIRRNESDGELLGTCEAESTGSMMPKTLTAHTESLAGVSSLCLVFRENKPETQEKPDVRLWYAHVGEAETNIWAQFKDSDPTEQEVEFNVRRTVFYPDQTGIDYLTVSGFTMAHAATPWAPPTAEQVGLIGTNWSKGWVIENNDIRYSVCTGIALGKYGDEYDNTSADSAEGYVETLYRALERGWSKDNIGSHNVRNNHISHCEQAGIVGSLGAAFSTITDNIIHDINIRAHFGGAEMAGIKFHGAIDAVICRNQISRAVRGIWLDWMTQGTRVTRNLLHNNGPREDVFVEVNQGPFLVDNNILLSRIGMLVNSHGGAYVHNLIAGEVRVIHTEKRETPYHKPHSTEVMGLNGNPSGDDRYHNNIFVGGGLAAYDEATLPVFMSGNVFLNGARPSKHEQDPLVLPDMNPGLNLTERGVGSELQIKLDPSWANVGRQLITTDLLGAAMTPGLGYENADGTPYRILADYLGSRRDDGNPFPGPFRKPAAGTDAFVVWPSA